MGKYVILEVDEREIEARKCFTASFLNNLGNQALQEWAWLAEMGMGVN